VVGEVSIYSGDDLTPVAHATGTYSIPPQDWSILTFKYPNHTRQYFWR
jgi:hypothetical protein